jgi:hypothetical protein
MNKPIDWPAIAAPLDVMDIEVPPTYLCRWISYERTETGVVFQCETAGEQPARFQVDIITPVATGSLLS